jgi:hypothetical protein
MKLSRALTFAAFAAIGIAAIATAASLRDEPATAGTAAQSEVVSAVPLETDMSECLAKCKREYASCSDGGTKNVTACLAKQKTCIDACK